MTNTIARDIAATLAESGVCDFFMLTGGDQALWIALRDQGIRMLVARSEASAVYMADGFARARGAPAVVYGQAGPGAANVSAALADALWAQSPVFALTGNTATNAMHVNEYQALDQYAMFTPVTKWNGRVAHPGQAAALTRHALQMAVTGTPGPTHLDVPKDMFGQVSSGRPPALAHAWPTPSAAPSDLAGVDAVMAALRRATRPMLLVGEGVRTAGAWHELAAFATAARLPIVATMGGKPAIASDHPNFVGIVGRYSSIAANTLAASADCVLALGTRLGGLATNGWRIPAPDATVLQIDHDPTAFVNPYYPETGIVADLRQALAALTAATANGAEKHDDVWVAHCQETAARWREELERQTRTVDDASPLSPLTVLAALRAYGRDCTLVVDTGYMAAWTGVLFPVERPDAFFRATGSLGWALPASLGVQLARPEKIVCVIGDGGIGYHLADIETAVRYQLPVVILVLNNDCLAFEYHEQKYRWNGDVVAQANDFTRVNYARAAEALGANGCRVETREALVAVLKSAMEASVPYVIDIAIDREAYPPVTNFDAHLKRSL